MPLAPAAAPEGRGTVRARKPLAPLAPLDQAPVVDLVHGEVWQAGRYVLKTADGRRTR